MIFTKLVLCRTSLPDLRIIGRTLRLAGVTSCYWTVLEFCPPSCEIPIRSMEGSPLVPMMYSAQRAVALIVDEGRRVADVARDLGLTEATPYRWKPQTLVDRGEVPGTSPVESAQLRDACPSGATAITATDCPASADCATRCLPKRSGP
ncbi:transposase [Nocardia sp. NPDC004750]